MDEQQACSAFKMDLIGNPNICTKCKCHKSLHQPQGGAPAKIQQGAGIKNLINQFNQPKNKEEPNKLPQTKPSPKKISPQLEFLQPKQIEQQQQQKQPIETGSISFKEKQKLISGQIAFGMGPLPQSLPKNNTIGFVDEEFKACKTDEAFQVIMERPVQQQLKRKKTEKVMDFDDD